MAPGGQPSDAIDLTKYFQMPEKAVAQKLGICLTSLKKLCRQQGINRWPYRKIKSLDKRLKDLEDAMSSTSDASVQLLTSGGVTDALHCEEQHFDAPSPSNSDGTDASVATTPRQYYDAVEHDCPVAFAVAPYVSAAKPRQSSKSPVSCQNSAATCRPVMPAESSKPRPTIELSDEDLISMLAECVQKPPQQESSPQFMPAHTECFIEGSDGAAISLGQRDVEILSDLVGCAAPFQMETFTTCPDFTFSVSDTHESFVRPIGACEDDFTDSFCWAFSSGPQEMR